MGQKIVKACFKLAMVLIVAGGCLSCAKRSYIDVDYRLPLATTTLSGRTVFVETLDLRSDPETFNKRAKEKFEHFTGLFALALETPDNQQKIVGAYPVPMLFETAIKQRLKNLGVGVAAEPSAGLPVLQIKLSQFQINLVGQKWQTDISYEASLAHDSQRATREVVSGSAERMRVLGTRDAEKMISEIFTDMINRLNIERLFQQAQ